MRHPIMRDDELITIFFGDADVKVPWLGLDYTLAHSSVTSPPFPHQHHHPPGVVFFLACGFAAG